LFSLYYLLKLPYTDFSFLFSFSSSSSRLLLLIVFFYFNFHQLLLSSLRFTQNHAVQGILLFLKTFTAFVLQQSKVRQSRFMISSMNHSRIYDYQFNQNDEKYFRIKLNKCAFLIVEISFFFCFASSIDRKKNQTSIISLFSLGLTYFFLFKPPLLHHFLRVLLKKT